MNLFLPVVILLSCTPVLHSYKILAFFTNPGRSHFEVFRPLLVELNERRHNLTVVSHFPSGVKNSESYRELIFQNKLQEGLLVHNLFDKGNVRIYAIQSAHRVEKKSREHCDANLSDDVVQELIRMDEDYDLIILEYFGGDCFFGFIDKLKAPVIGVSSTPVLPWHNERFGNIDNPSYIPNQFYVHSNKMNFWERLENFLTLEYHKYFFNTYISKNDIFFINKFFNRTIDSMKELVKNYSSLLLVNTHFSLHYTRPLVQNIIEVGGIHLAQETGGKLPRNIEKFINESTHGVIYFSLGSMIKGHTFPQEKRQEFLKAFARLPQRVLWKWENETMPGKPDNVMIQKWMPQFDILSHPNVKAFISHGGLLGTTEAVHCGVPMLVMPQYGDQHTNAKAIEVNGGGVILYLRDATEEKVYQGLKTILDPEFREKAQALSERFRDRPMSPMDTAIYWVEYVARHKGAPHMRTAAVDMPLYQYLLLDVLAFLAAIAIILLYITYKFTRLIFRVIFPKKKMKQS